MRGMASDALPTASTSTAGPRPRRESCLKIKAKLKHLQNIFIYAPQDKDLYKEVEAKKYDLDDLDKVLEGKFRPGHFNGVATIVLKFFNFSLLSSFIKYFFP